jgi:hypothetical protein
MKTRKTKFILLFILSIALFSLGCESNIPKIQFDLNPVESPKFLWSNSDDSYLKDLNTEYQLDSMVNGLQDDLEKAKVITHWVHNLWEHDGLNAPEKSDPSYIIRQALAGKKFRCIEYSIVIQGCLTAIDIKSRIVVLMRKDVETVDKWGSHYVVEAYLDEHDKWCMIDGQWNAIPLREGVPLNAVEFQETLAHEKFSITLHNRSFNRSKRYYDWVGPSLYYFQYYIDNRVDGTDRSDDKIILVPIGAKNPMVFQKKWPIKNAVYTHAIAMAYQ